ncbi:hypothetical protein B0H14DRAFT_2649125 [Mycena olivaceomarginata]|nr:hypothetical protein B0H14DRAFT_2649125 [Mycena olivaceomarginata]
MYAGLRQSCMERSGIGMVGNLEETWCNAESAGNGSCQPSLIVIGIGFPRSYREATGGWEGRERGWGGADVGAWAQRIPFFDVATKQWVGGGGPEAGCGGGGPEAGCGGGGGRKQGAAGAGGGSKRRERRGIKVQGQRGRSRTQISGAAEEVAAFGQGRGAGAGCSGGGGSAAKWRRSGERGGGVSGCRGKGGEAGPKYQEQRRKWRLLMRTKHDSARIRRTDCAPDDAAGGNAPPTGLNI